VSEIDRLLARLEDRQKRLCLRILAAFSSCVGGVATTGEIFNILNKEGGHGFVHYEQVRILIANFLVPNGFVSRGPGNDRRITDQGRMLYQRMRDSVELPSPVPNRELMAPDITKLVGQIGRLIEGLSQGGRRQVLIEALKRFC